MAGSRHDMCELTARHGRGTAWARHAISETVLNVQLTGPTSLHTLGRQEKDIRVSVKKLPTAIIFVDFSCQTPQI